jgi:hypothetical protein
MPTRTVRPTASTSTHAVSRFRDTDAHCMSGFGDWQPAQPVKGRSWRSTGSHTPCSR